MVERSFTCATSPSTRLSLLPSHPAAIMMATQSTRPVAVKACKTEIARGLFSRFVMLSAIADNYKTTRLAGSEFQQLIGLFAPCSDDGSPEYRQ